jgi:hypothetical protein
MGTIWGENRAEIDSDDDDHDDISEGDDMDDSGEDNDDEESGNDEDDDEERTKKMEIFIRTFHNGDYDIQFEAALSFDRGVTLPVRPTQASYNKPDNWIERNRIGLEKVKGQLQTCIDSAINKKMYNLQLIHNGYQLIHNSYENQLLDNEEPIVWHESVLDEYWDQLEDALSGDELVTNICGIEIMNVQMKKERLAALVTALSEQVSSSAYIQFHNTNLCGESIISLSELLDVSTTLQSFSISHNRIDNMESARCLSRSLKSHSCIKDLQLYRCDLGSSPEILAVILQSDISLINLSNNNIDSLGAVKIAQYLESDPPIEYLLLGHNRLNDDDVILISQALKRNTNLKTIHIHTNNFTAIGVKALLTCAFDSSSLNAISESNHNLTRIEMFHNHNDKLAGCIDRFVKLDRKLCLPCKTRIHYSNILQIYQRN